MDEKQGDDLLKMLEEKKKRQLMTPSNLFLNENGAAIKCEFCGAELTTDNFDELRSVLHHVLPIIIKHGFDKSNPQPAKVQGCAGKDFQKQSFSGEDHKHRVCLSCYGKVETYIFPPDRFTRILI